MRTSAAIIASFAALAASAPLGSLPVVGSAVPEVGLPALPEVPVVGGLTGGLPKVDVPVKRALPEVPVVGGLVNGLTGGLPKVDVPVKRALPEVPVVGGLVNGLTGGLTGGLPKVDVPVKRAIAELGSVNSEETIKNAIDILNGLLAEQQAAKRDVLSTATNTVGNLHVVPTVDGALGTVSGAVGGVLKRAVVPAVNNIVGNLDVGSTVNGAVGTVDGTVNGVVKREINVPVVSLPLLYLIFSAAC
jgi:hypothetical protein